MYAYKLIIAYDGTHYNGWQMQSNALAIQEVLQKKMSQILQIDINLMGSGRTDAGVHAYGQVAHFHVPSPIDMYRFKHSLNGLLPLDIRILNMEPVPLSFHARHSAIGKFYHYHLSCQPIQDPFKRLYSLHVYQKIDFKLLSEAATYFVGTHDFTSFANETHKGAVATNPIRTIKRLDVIIENDQVCLIFEGNGFLYQMVRNITGTLIEIALNKRKISSIPCIFAQKSRKASGKAAPPHGLFLMEVTYPSHY